MIVCPNCSHQNPDAAIQCEACYTPLPAMTTCPSCGAAVQTDASFCGQCGFNLQAAQERPAAPNALPDLAELNIPPLVSPDPLVEAGKFEATLTSATQSNLLESDPSASNLPLSELPPIAAMPEPEPNPEANSEANPESNLEAALPSEPELPPAAPVKPAVPASNSQTQLQTQTAQLLHVQTNTTVELPSTLAVIHIGKPNDRIPPDVDVSGYPHSEIVSRIHADIRVEGDIYYIEDVGSSNGTYINNAPLPSGNRHRLRPGDRIALGKGDKVTFLFQVS
ncbi:MAG: FHA domain-containing protein [Pegethrix bostrychoides GSE-TBD4-15B]|jgi:pSer/pThr/pTyr-binding forkhead associated (FHA) protein/ribosomal protein L40E|uniref:FHA domain-containing protein n=1 Tax=Pegethrix bostrychoides GSE-TBD4-15B TaxID=2839662 RepID=A0A951PBE5_9CYAN|nr:FHA domain-containing protein [Pegethrix bostrychoides GSE-TBD4-15B]